MPRGTNLSGGGALNTQGAREFCKYHFLSRKQHKICQWLIWRRLFANSQKRQTLKICIALRQVSNCIRPRIKIHLSVLSLLKLHRKNLWHKNITTAKQMPIELHPRQHNEVFYITPENSWFICLTKDAFVTHKTSVRT